MGKSMINPALEAYINKKIIPMYDFFDDAHNRAHVMQVIKNSQQIAQHYEVDDNKVFTIAAYHDTGLTQGRKDHEKSSALFLLADTALTQWFTQAELLLMAEAVEDHRASKTEPPRSIYGKIVAEADRDIEYTRIFTRVIQYSIAAYPHYTLEAHYQRCYTHMQEKYGVDGYLKLWLDSEPNRGELQKIRDSLANADIFNGEFMRLFALFIPPTPPTK